jgi:hypothetical protein
VADVWAYNPAGAISGRNCRIKGQRERVPSSDSCRSPASHRPLGNLVWCYVRPHLTIKGQGGKGTPLNTRAPTAFYVRTTLPPSQSPRTTMPSAIWWLAFLSLQYCDAASSWPSVEEFRTRSQPVTQASVQYRGQKALVSSVEPRPHGTRPTF